MTRQETVNKLIERVKVLRPTAIRRIAEHIPYDPAKALKDFSWTVGLNETEIKAFTKHSINLKEELLKYADYREEKQLVAQRAKELRK